MGRSKFPGKPSKSVMKERIRVLFKNENGKSGKDAYGNLNKRNCGEVLDSKDCSLEVSTDNDKLRNFIDADLTDKQINLIQDASEKNAETEGSKNDPGQKHFSGGILELHEEKNESASDISAGMYCTLNAKMCTTGYTKYSLSELDKLIKKKTVTFKNVLETSDDILMIKKIHNPLHKGPLVSIMKKECTTSQSYSTRGDGIVRPSRLTEILKNNENIDKTKSLSFRSVQISENKKYDALQDNQTGLPSRKCTPKIMFLAKEEKQESEFRLKNQNENVEKLGINLESNNSQPMEKWKLHKLYPKSDNFDTRDEHMDDLFRKRYPKAKDSLVQNKIILRQPRLHFEPKSEISGKGKQSSLSHCNNPNLLSNNLCSYSVCGVCNTMVNSKNLQNRKYGIIACDACRKFISKITKKTVSSSTNPLTSFKIQCSKRDGECVISSLPKNNVKSFKKIYDERCSACWLKKCIKSFHFPSGHKLRLNAILSETHKTKLDIKSANKPRDLSQLANTFKYRSEVVGENDYANSQTNSMSWRVLTTSGGPIGLPKSYGEIASLSSTEEPFLDSNLAFEVNSKATQPLCVQHLSNDNSCTSGKHTRLYSNSILNKKSQSILCNSIELQTPNSIVTPEYPKRQKIDFKGPRVKHVCRSASSALGQQIATFSNADEEIPKLLQHRSEIENNCLSNSLLGNIYFSGNEQENYSRKTTYELEEVRAKSDDGEKIIAQDCTLNNAEVERQSPQIECTEKSQKASIKDKKTILFEKSFPNERYSCQLQKSAQKYSANKNVFMLAHRNISSLSKRNLMRITKARNCEKKSKIISIDFWDTYIPAEVNQAGFGLIFTEPAPIYALCFLCGSMDLDYLLFCASCCEPYHSYCIQEEHHSLYSNFPEKNIADNVENTNEDLSQLNWVCPRCTICYTCNMSSGAKLKCQKCKKNYHSTCMGTSKGLLGADRPLICRSCLKCQTCSTTKVSKYVGNQPICMQCFNHRMSGSRCPLCNNLFDDILDTIILECGFCEKLIHAKCEGLTEEQSNLLSNLSGNIKFVCKKCSLANNSAKVLANEWREAVYAELKTGLLNVLKLLSRSRQANALKKNMNKNCLCSFDQIKNSHHILSYQNQNFQKKEERNLSDTSFHSKCLCYNGIFQQPRVNTTISLFDIKKKIISGEYVSLFDFNTDMISAIMPLKNDELILAYKEILSEKFSWFQNETKTCTDALEEDMFESCNYCFQLDEVVADDQDTLTKLPDSVVKILKSVKRETDNRVCVFCTKEGDGGVFQESRLLYYGYNVWIHANCAIWSNDVYEEFDGTLQNVHNALNRGRSIKCFFCNWPGATIKCYVKTCCRYYHFQCARKAECVFKSDKSVYCAIHSTEGKVNNSSTKLTFTVCRPLYIEFDKTSRKCVEPSKVQFMMGSLSVLQLGTVYSKYSDTSEAIVPINFVCTRLYWSCKEPWKIVKYSVRTSIQHSSVTVANDIGTNFTVDHSNNADQVENALSQIASWHNTLIREDNSDVTLHHDYSQFGTVRFSTNGDNHNETISDTYIEEEPQNNSDLLPPEIKDAIFEDLPHDILDGISMLDIFPKLMIYEDLISIEGKSDNMLISEAAENCAIQISEDCPTLSSLNKQESSNKFTFNINRMEDTNFANGPKRELHRSNSEVFFRNFESYRSQQRSSSVTWSCKFDNTKRYFSKGPSDVGQSDTRLLSSNCKKIENEYYDEYKTNSKKKRIFEDNKHLTQIKKDKLKLMQLDGADDTIMSFLTTHVHDANSKSPVKCDRCHCTYRTLDSFQRHLISCEQISTSESETETLSHSPEASHPTIVFQAGSIKNNLPIYQNQLANNQKLSANISIVSDPNLISSEHVIPQNIYVTNSAGFDDGFYVNLKESGYNNVFRKESNNINNDYVENNWQNVSGVTGFNKSVSKNKKVKSNNNITNSNSKPKNEHYKVCTITKPETTVTAEPINVLNDKTEYDTQGKHSYLQFLNQHLVLNNQYSQKEQQSQQQQFVVIQQSVGNNQPLFIQQVQNPSTMPQNIFPLVLPNNSIQYTSIPTSTSPLVQGSILQTDASGNVVLSSGIQMLSIPSLQLSSQSSPQIVGSFNQPQSLHLGSNQMLIGGTTTMELMPNANQLLLTAPPVYYGLETIVQNTVMSSQQFVSTAMQGVLSQNASFSATTTQVFQSSKFEPVSDAPSGYVVLNNADGTAIVVPQTNLLSGFMNTNSTHSNYAQDFGNICGTHPQTYIQQPQPNNVLPLIPTLSDMTRISVETPMHRIQSAVNLESNSHIVSPAKRTFKLASTVDNISPNNASSISNQISVNNSSLCNLKDSDEEEILMVANNYNNDFNIQITCKDSNIFETQSKSAEITHIRSKSRAQLKPKLAQKYVKRSRVSKSTKMIPKLLYTNIVQKEKQTTNSDNLNKKINLETGTHYKISEEDINYQRISEVERKDSEGRIESSDVFLGLNDSIQSIGPRLNNRPTSQSYVANTIKLPHTTASFGSSCNNVPTNIVAPILQTLQNNSIPSRPTNRVLPMQSIHKPVDKSTKSTTLKRISLKDSLSKLLDTVPSHIEIKKKAIPIIQNLESNNNEVSVLDPQDFELKNMIAILQSKNELAETKSNSSYRANRLTLLQKLPISEDVLDSKKTAEISKDYILDNLEKNDRDNLKSKGDDDFSFENTLCNGKAVDKGTETIVQRTDQYMDPQLQKLHDEPFAESLKQDFKLKSSKQVSADRNSFIKSCHMVSPFPSKNGIPNADIKNTSEPHLIYEIQSEDGFCYKSKSIADVWEKVFEAVQSARRAHGLPSLPIGPFADMCGVQMIGLKTDALKYLIEQLPGTEKCTKYTPKYHKNTSTNGNGTSEYVNQDRDELLESVSGAIRCEQFRRRSDYDLFSWLASRHRKQPKQIFVQPSDTELIARRCTANLPMAMKYRTLKETCKHNVGVFRSLIHGRGLFCTKDIEAGEMVIEYAGELIRSTLTDKRERFYDSRGIGCYMFKIDDNFVVDATMRGNAARFINHSCEPNCYSKVVDILGHKHIIIFSLRRIVKGEELTYDYKFPFEDVKIPCSCGSKKCRKYLN